MAKREGRDPALQVALRQLSSPLLLVRKHFHLPANVLLQNPVLEQVRDPGVVVINRAMIEECSGMLRDVALHAAELLALLGPPAIELSPLRKEVDIQFAAAGMTEKVSLVGAERVCTQDAF